MSPQKKKQPVNFQNSFSFVFRLSQGQSQNTCLHFNTASWAKLRLSWHVASSVCACVCSTSQKTLKILLCGGLNYGCREKLHLICICTNGMWAVWRSVSAVSALKQHCVNTNLYNTQHTSYTPCVSLKRTANRQLNAAQCFWSSQQLNSQSVNMEQEGSLPCAQQSNTFP